MRHRIAAVALASGLAGVTAGFALGIPTITEAATSPSAATTTDGAAAQPPGRPGRWVTDALRGLVENHTITQAQADKVAEALEAARPDFGPRGHRGPPLEIVAKAIGISVTDLRTALQSGTSIADVAKQHHVDPATVIDALVAEQVARSAAAVKDGKLTQAQADARQAEAKQHITEFVNNAAPNGWDHDGRGPTGGDGPEPPATDSASAPASLGA